MENNKLFIFFLTLLVAVLDFGVGDPCKPGTCSLNPRVNSACTIPADTLCPPNICNDHGTCYHHSNGTIYCNCTHQYYGDRCEHDVRNTESRYTCNPAMKGTELYKPCQELGTERARCEKNATDGEYVCHCGQGLYGEFCEHETRFEITPDQNTTAVCLNGGTHYFGLLHGLSVKCWCPCGFYGDRCEKMAKEAADVEGCNNIMCHGNGICKSYGGHSEMFCKCNDGFGGKRCDIVVSSGRMNDAKTTLYTLLFAALSFIAVM